ncbi:hypothetical protein D9M68_818150 [compost metagenome]
MARPRMKFGKISTTGMIARLGNRALGRSASPGKHRVLGQSESNCPWLELTIHSDVIDAVAPAGQALRAGHCTDPHGVPLSSPRVQTAAAS